MTSKTTGTQVDAYTYDLRGKQKSFTPAGGSATCYGYAPSGNRVSKTTGATTTDYLVDSMNPTGYAQVLAETTGTDKIYYMLGSDVIGQAVNAASPQYFVYDGHGSVRQMATAAGALVADQNFWYDAWGNIVSGDTSASQTQYLYCGEQFDTESGLYYLRARMYNPQNGRFTSVDPYSGNNTDPQSLHKYLYCHGNPINGIDPTGNEYSLPNVTVTISIIGTQASQYISRIPSSAVVAFRSGGQAIGAFFNQFGPVVQNFGQQVINQIPRIQMLRPVLEGFSRRPDFVLRAGNTLRAIEGKYQLPANGEALTRLGAQLQQFAQWVSQGTGREVVIWALKNPENATKAEQVVLQAAGNPQGVRFVYGVEGLFQYLSQWAGL